MKSVARVLLFSAVACLILLPVSVQVNSPAIYPTIIADGPGPTPPPPPPGNTLVTGSAGIEVLIADGPGPTPPPPPPGNTGVTGAARVEVLIADGPGPTPPPPPPGNMIAIPGELLSVG
jgi:hypothetical protein